MPSHIDENKLGQATLEANHDNHETVLPEEQTKDAQIESLLHGVEGGQPTHEELEGMGISRDTKDWKAALKAKVFDYEHHDVETLDDIKDPIEDYDESVKTEL